MKFLILLFSVGFLFSCNNSEKPKPNFEYIDFSWGGGWNGKAFSVKITSNKNIFYREILFDKNQTKKCYRGIIDDSLYNFIISQIDLLNNAIKDSSMDLICSDCSFGKIIIQTDTSKIIAQIVFHFEKNKIFNSLTTKLQDYQYHKKLSPTDSCVNYDSFLKALIPPIPKVIKFIPPISKSEN